MKQYFLLAVKRLLRSPAFVISMALLVVCVTAASFCGGGFLHLFSGVYAPDTPLAEKTAEGLKAYDFIRYTDRDSLVEDLKNKKIGCAAVLPDDFDNRVKSCDLEGAVQFIYAKETAVPSLFKTAASAEVLAVAAPYISSATFGYADISVQTAEEYEKYMRGGPMFTFEVVYTDGTAADEADFPLALASAGIAVMLFAAALVQAGRISEGGYTEIAARIGPDKAFWRVFVPELLAWAILSTVSVAVSAFAFAGVTESGALLRYVPYFMIYTVSAAAVGMLVGTVLKGQAAHLLIVPVLLLTAVLCPVFADLSVFVPAVKYIRLALPTYLVYLIPERPVTVLAASAALLALALFISYRQSKCLILKPRKK